MNALKKTILGGVVIYLRKKDIPQHLWPERIKKIGSWFFLGSALPIIPLLLIEHVPLAVIIIFQLMFLACIFIGNFLVDYAKN